MTRKTFLLRLFVFVFFTGTIVFGVSVNLNNVDMSDLTLSNIGILAQNEDNGEQCPGGSCHFTWNDGSACLACCQVGKDPSCSPSGGCQCI